MRAERLAALAADPDAPPFFGRTDRDAEAPATGRRGRSTSAAGTSATRPATRSSSTGGRRSPRPFYRATPDRPDGRAAAPPVRLPRRPADVLRGRAPRPRRGARAGLGPAARGDRASPRRPDARHRGDHPARPGRPGARRPGHVAVHPGRARHRQDRGRPAPRRVPALHLPRAAAALRRPGRRARTPPSCTTSPRCCRPSARAASSRPPWTSWSALAGRAADEPADRARRSRATRGWPTCCAGRVLSHIAQAGRGRRRRSSAPAATGSARITCAATSTTPAARSADGLRWSTARERLRTADRRGRAAAARGRRRRTVGRRDGAGGPLAGGARVRRRGLAGADSAPALLARLYDRPGVPAPRCAGRR